MTAFSTFKKLSVSALVLGALAIPAQVRAEEDRKSVV